LKVHLQLSPPSPYLGLRLFLVFLALLAVGAVAYSEWSSSALQRDVESRSQAIWSACTLVAAAESDYHAAYWVSDAHQAEAETTLKRQLNSFGRLRSPQEWDEWRRLSAIVARRFRVERAAQVAPSDHQFSEQLMALRAAIEKTDQAERARVLRETATLRGQLWMRLLILAILAGLAAAAHFLLLSRRPGRRVRRRRRRETVQGLGIE
jgi:hypothetical protein